LPALQCHNRTGKRPADVSITVILRAIKGGFEKFELAQFHRAFIAHPGYRTAEQPECNFGG
jgi:hypothetical protein